MIRKAVGTLLIITGLILLIPEGLEWINLGIGHYLSEVLGLSLFHGVLISFTIVPLVLIVCGAILMPGNTQGILTGIYQKIIAVLRRMIASPWGLLLIAGALMLSYIVYAEILAPYIESII